MRRRILAISASALLLGALAVSYWWPSEELVLACFWRGGAILAAAWLAFDDVQRLPNWLVVSLPVVLIVLVRWPKLLWAILPLLILLAVLRRLFLPDAAKRSG